MHVHKGGRWEGVWLMLSPCQNSKTRYQIFLILAGKVLLCVGLSPFYIRPSKKRKICMMVPKLGPQVVGEARWLVR